MKLTKQTYYRKALAQRALTMDALVAVVKDGRTKQTIETFRAKWKYSLPDRRGKLASCLPALLFAGTFRKGEMKEYNGWVLLEIIHLKSIAEAEGLKRRVSAYPQVLFAMTGGDGHSLVFIVPYTRPDGSLPQARGEAELFHAHACRHALKTFEPRIGCSVELRRPMLEQSCIISYDPNVYHNPEALAIHLEQPSGMPDESGYQENYEKIPPAESIGKTIYDRYRYVSIQYELAFRQAFDGHSERGGGLDFKPMLVHLAGLCFGAGIGEEDCVKWTMAYLDSLLAEVEIRETVGNAYRMGAAPGEAVLCKPEQLQALRIEEFMRRRYEFRFNTMTGAPEYRERNSFCFSFRPVTNRVMNSIALNAQKEGLLLWDRDVRRFLHSDRLADHAPIEDYLKQLPPWDGTDRIGALAGRIPCDNPQWKRMFRIWFLSMVAHWQGRNKLYGNSLSPMLVGGQGCGKSTFCMSLIPPELKSYYTDSIDFSKKRDAELYLTRFALINIDEYDQVSERHQGFLKHLLQKPVVNVRKPYAIQVVAMRRYASFIATSNHSDLLNDPSGSRRFICVRVNGMIDNTQPVAHEQLYAQAVALLDKNERYWLTHDEEQMQMKVNEEFRQHPLYEDLFHQYYLSASRPEEGVKMSAGELYLSLQKKSNTKLPAGKISYFGRFLKKAVQLTYNTSRGTLYRVVEK